MDTTSHTTEPTYDRPAGVPEGWEHLRDADGESLGWVGHRSQGPRLIAEAYIDPATDPTLTPIFSLDTPYSPHNLSAAELHQFAAQFFDFYREVCTHLPGVETPQRLASDQWREV